MEMLLNSRVSCLAKPCNLRTLRMSPFTSSFIIDAHHALIPSSDMIFGIKETLAYLSQGTTLEKGTIIQMGTPSGIGWARKPQRIIQNGEAMHIWFEGIGTLVNKFVFE